MFYPYGTVSVLQSQHFSQPLLRKEGMQDLKIIFFTFVNLYRFSVLKNHHPMTRSGMMEEVLDPPALSPALRGEGRAEPYIQLENSRIIRWDASNGKHQFLIQDRLKTPPYTILG
jgi:hypothetical protein